MRGVRAAALVNTKRRSWHTEWLIQHWQMDTFAQADELGVHVTTVRRWRRQIAMLEPRFSETRRRMEWEDGKDTV